MESKLKKIFAKKPLSKEDIINIKIQDYISKGRIPWSNGYIEYKFKSLNDNLIDINVLNSFKNKELPSDYGYGLDERIVEIPWALSKLNSKEEKLLDAGSSLNFKEIIELDKIKNKDLSILTFDPEKNNYSEERISYIYSDLRDLPFKNNLFDSVISISTIEHIDMDNSIYGWNENNKVIDQQKKSYSYLKVIDELIRVLKSGGQLLITFPFGKFENHGFFQQFDDEMLTKITTIFDKFGSYEQTFFKYEKEGWRFCEKDECAEIVSYNPHTGKGKLDDGAAHCRSVCCLEFFKS